MVQCIGLQQVQSSYLLDGVLGTDSWSLVLLVHLHHHSIQSTTYSIEETRSGGWNQAQIIRSSKMIEH